MSTRFFSALLMLILFFAVPVYCDEPAKKGDELIAVIRHMEALLLRPCDKVENLMNELIVYGRNYQLIEEERANTYSEWTKAYVKYVSDFIVVQDENGTAIPGKFIKRFMDLKKMAEEGGVLADGPKPNMALIKLAHSKSASKYFYFEKSDSAEANKKRDLRYKLEEEYEKLVSDWNKARDEFYKQFDDKGVMKNHADSLGEQTKQGRDHQLKYLDLSSELSSLALSGNYEHCLGEMQAMKYSIVQGMGDNLFGPLYAQGEKKTPGSLPGMGYKFTAQKMYKPITKPEIGGFPLALHLKFNGTDYFKLERDLLEIKIKAEEDETKILGMGMGRLGEFGFQVVHKTAQSLAAPVLLVKYVVEHPVDSATKGANFIVGLPKAIGDIKPFELEKKAGDFLWGNTEKLFVSIGEIAKDLTPITWDRFDPKPNETLEQEIDRLKAKLDSTTKVKEGMEVASTLTSIVVEALLDKGITKGLNKLDDAVAAFKQQSKLQGLLNKVDDLQDAKKIASKIDDVQDANKIAGKIDDIVPDNKKAIQDLLKEQSDNSKEFSKFLTGDKPLEKGVKLGDDVGKKIGVVDNAGQQVQLRAGEQLGKPGGFNTAFVDADNSNLVIRKTNKPMTKEALEIADAHDKFGRNVLEKEVGGSSIRVAKIEGEFYEQTADGLVRYQKVERVSDTALDQVAKQGGSMTKGQQLALEQAHRDLNNSGYVWMDNTPKNYSFEKIPGGDDRWKLVVIDPDGIYPIKGKDANVAKAFQEAVNNTPKAIADIGGADDAMQKLFAFSDKYDEAAKKFNIPNDPNGAIDWDKLKQANPKMIKEGDIGELHWAPDSKRLDVPDEIAKLPDNKMVEAFDKHNFDQLLNDADYKKLVEKQKELNKKINEITEKVEPQIKQVEKSMEGGPKPPPQPDKPSGIDKDLADKLNFISQQTANAINAENCALLRKQALAGSKEEWLVKAVKDCVAQGF
jgi:hypothetical protein